MEQNYRQNKIIILIIILLLIVSFLVNIYFYILICTKGLDKTESGLAAVPFSFDDIECTMLKSEKIDGMIVKITKSQYNYNDIYISIGGYEKEIFPKELKCTEAYFFNYYKPISSSAGDTYRSEVYLECVYEIDTYNEEIERISNINKEWSKYTKRSVYVEDLFNLPAYVTIYNHDGKFVYALLDSSANRIIYIAFHDVKTIDNIVFDRAYAPYKDINDSSFPKELIHPRYKFYNMYAWYGM